MLFEKHNLVDCDKVQSLIKSEWSVIRTKQALIDDHWKNNLSTNRISDDACCGMLFTNNYAFACNGHWLMRTKVDFTSMDDTVKYFFYNYLTDEVMENYNPFAEVYNINEQNLFNITSTWCTYNVKMRVQDILDTLGSAVELVKNRRAYAMHASIGDSGMMGIRLETNKNVSDLLRIPIYSEGCTDFPEFSVNLSYFYKIIDIISDYYHVVDLCFNCDSQPLIIKAKNPKRPDKPDMRFALGNFSYN